MPKATVLIVDDSPLIRQVVADAFLPSGYHVLMAADGAEALRKIAQNPPDLIVADILMPVMDGWKLCEEVRRAAETSQIPFIFLTTEQEANKKVRGLRMGADDYLTKPFSREELLARAEIILSRARKLKDAEGAGEMLSGHTRHLSMADLLQILSLNGRTGVLKLQGAGGEEGRIYFREGRIVHAAVGRVAGEKALFRLMMWPETRFVLEDLPPSVAETIAATTSSVLMEGFTHWDELRNLADHLPPPST
ncbi:MAG TPA: response regulator, partial [Verrucomicrobiae bacterium]|nr:response regulator [Verrucomicrobiae bacterium]